MKILFCSYRYAPSVGGIETVSRILAAEFVAAGHEVCVVTESPGERPSATVPQIMRRPTRRELMNVVRWADVVFHNNVSLRYAWPLLLARKPWVVAHHTWLRRPDGAKGAVEHLKELCIRKATNISISAAIAQALPVASRVIPDPYEADIFHVRREVPRSRDLIFVGRLVSDKGVDVLFEALASLKTKPNLSIVGEGPERPRLEEQLRGAKLEAQVQFLGERTGPELSALLNQHRVLVVPSRWDEPFGVVALEAIACGCTVVGTRGGGLSGAIGACGVTVPNGDAPALAQAIQDRLISYEPDHSAKAEQHLKLHHPAAIAQKYLAVFEEARAAA